MAIITKGTVEKGTEAQFTLSKANLAADTLVAADAYFSVSSNWANVILEYKSDVGGQSKRVVFDATQATPTADFLASDTARDVFEIKRLVIVDHDGGKFTLNRANLTTAEFDLDLTAASGLFFSNTLKSSSLAVSNGGLTLTGVSAPYAEWGYLDGYTSTAGSDKVYFEMVQNVTSGGADNYLGVSFISADPSDFSDATWAFEPNAMFVYQGATTVLEAVAGVRNGLFPKNTIWVTNDVVMMAVDFINNKIWFGKNGTWNGGENPTSGSGGNDFTAAQGAFTRAYIGVCLGGTSQVTKVASPAYTPSGFTAI